MSTETAPKVIKASEVLKMLGEGKTRKDIGAHFGIKGAALKQVFAHPQLKGRKVKNADSPFTLEDDVTGTALAYKEKSEDGAVAETVEAKGTTASADKW